VIALDEPHLRLQALSLLLTRLERGEPVTPDDGGLNERALQRLRSLPVGELARLAAIKHLRVGILVDGDSLDYALRTLDRLSRESTLLERCVAHHAPRALLAELFGSPAIALAGRQRRQRGEQAPRGRPRLPDAETRDSIHARWHALQDCNLKPAERYLALAEAYPEFTLASLHAVVHEFDD
jgi:hypothetical protein